MGRETHVIDIRGRLSIFRHRDRIRPETEVIHTIRTLCHSEERLAVCALNPGDKDILPAELDGTGIHDGVDAEPFHQIRVGLLMEIVTPFQRSVSRGKHRIHIALVNTITLNRDVLFGNKFLMRLLKPLQSLFVRHNNTISFFSLNSLKSSAFSKPFQGP